MIQKIGGFGIAIDENCAIEFIENKYFRVLTARKDATAYKVYKKNGRVISEKIRQEKHLLPFAELYKN